MPRLEIEGQGTFEVAEGTRLVLAIEGQGVDILHRCGGNARCTTCRIEFTSGEPQHMTVAEKNKLAERDLLGKVRLSCQCVVDHDMAVHVLMTQTSENLTDPGDPPAPEITPPAEWTTMA
ncbi:MAG: (2Fe-2S)-binding protein [Herpetosiphonaceae bacterium]|nr:(2Fe-2S)-binding protein [Herpetosiphonaceae bacterium]